jgi:hypothetical protein
MVTYNRKFGDRFELEAGLGISNIHHSYVVGLYNPTFNEYTRKVGGKRVTTLTLPFNVNFRILGGFYLKAGLSASLGFSSDSEATYFEDTPEINDTYNSMQDIFNSHSFGYGIGCGYRIGRFDLMYYRRTSLTDMTSPINVNGKEYQVFGDFHTNTFLVTYSIFFKGKSEEQPE